MVGQNVECSLFFRYLFHKTMISGLCLQLFNEGKNVYSHCLNPYSISYIKKSSFQAVWKNKQSQSSTPKALLLLKSPGEGGKELAENRPQQRRCDIWMGDSNQCTTIVFKWGDASDIPALEKDKVNLVGHSLHAPSRFFFLFSLSL